MSTALFIGRFQPFHFGHLDAIRQILGENNKLFVIIGSINKSGSQTNPLAMPDRLELIQKTLKKEKINTSLISFFYVPDLNDDKKWTKYILDYLPKFDIVYSGTNDTIDLFKKTHNTKLLKKNLNISATKVRKKIKEDDPDWKNWTYLDEKKAKIIAGIKK